MLRFQMLGEFMQIHKLGDFAFALAICMVFGGCPGDSNGADGGGRTGGGEPNPRLDAGVNNPSMIGNGS